MSIVEVKMYTVVCDNCKKDVAEGADYSCWNDEKYAEDCALEEGWINENDKHYCPKCYEYDDDDNLIIKHTK